MLLSQQLELAAAMVLKLAPNAEKKFPSISNSLQLKFLDKNTEITLAKITNSFPQQLFE